VVFSVKIKPGRARAGKGAHDFRGRKVGSPGPSYGRTERRASKNVTLEFLKEYQSDLHGDPDSLEVGSVSHVNHLRYLRHHNKDGWW
jgi:hypothetical protein